MAFLNENFRAFPKADFFMGCSEQEIIIFGPRLFQVSPQKFIEFSWSKESRVHDGGFRKQITTYFLISEQGITPVMISLHVFRNRSFFRKRFYPASAKIDLSFTL